MDEDILKFKELVSEIDISKYNQEDFREIVNVIHFEIFGNEPNDDNWYVE